MSRPGPSAPRHCRDAIVLPASLIVGALAMEPAATSEDIIDVPDCTLQAGHDDHHHGLVASVKGDYAVWAVWGDDGTPHLEWLLDCNTGPNGTFDNGCILFARHRGLHSFDLYDPMMAAARTALASLPPDLRTGLDRLFGI